MNGSPSTPTPRTGLSGLADRALNLVERTGNRLPDPITLFVVFMGMVLVISWVAYLLGASAVHPGTQEEIRAVNLLTAESIQRILIEMPRTFTDFPPLGLVLVVMIGIGVAERTGLIETALKGFVRSVPGWFVTTAIVFGGLMSSLAVDAGYVVLIPLGAVIFHGMGRHPIAGLAYDGIAAIGALARAGRSDALTAAALTQPSGFVGVGGIFRLLADGTNERGLAIAEIRNNQVHVIDPAPRSFGAAGF